jgi:3D (Asp-Asp-Asp) domain-containing protein
MLCNAQAQLQAKHLGCYKAHTLMTTRTYPKSEGSSMTHSTRVALRDPRGVSTIRVTPQVFGLHLALALQEPKNHLFTYEHGTYGTHM